MNLIAYFLILIVGLGSTTAFACDGPDPGPVQDRFKDAEFVAVVRVTSLSVSSSNPSKVEGKAEVVEMLKGTQVATMPVYGYTPSVDCWASIDVGREYVVFLPNPIGQMDAWFSMFSKTIPVADVPETLLREWRTKT